MTTKDKNVVTMTTDSCLQCRASLVCLTTPESNIETKVEYSSQYICSEIVYGARWLLRHVSQDLYLPIPSVSVSDRYIVGATTIFFGREAVMQCPRLRESSKLTW